MYENDPNTSDHGRNNLDCEHHAGRDFHIMTKLQVTGKSNGLARGHEGNRFEDGVGDGFSRKYVPSDKLIQHLYGDLLICDCLKYGKRKCHEGRNDDPKGGSPDRELSWINFNGNTEQSKESNANRNVPPHRNFRVGLHETGMDILSIL